MSQYQEEGAIVPSQLQVNKLYKIKRRDEANPGRNKMIPFEYMGSDADPFPLKFRYLETDEIVRYKVNPLTTGVVRQGANGPTFIYPYNETLRNAALRFIDPRYTFDYSGYARSPNPPETIADFNSRAIATDIATNVKRENKLLTGDEISEVQGHPGGGTSGAKRRRKTKKSRKTKKRKNTRRY